MELKHEKITQYIPATFLAVPIAFISHERKQVAIQFLTGHIKAICRECTSFNCINMRLSFYLHTNKKADKMSM